MNPNQSQWSQPQSWLNIDQMLQTLSTNPVIVPITPQTSSVPATDKPATIAWSNFSIENLTKPLMPSLSETIENKARSFTLPAWTKVAWSVVMTFSIIAIGGWMFTIQYPLESKEYFDTFFGILSDVKNITQNNLAQDSIIISSWAINTDDTHTVAPDNYIDSSPLTDAIDKAQNTEQSWTAISQTLDTIISGDNASTTTSNSDTTSLSGSDKSLPTVSTGSIVTSWTTMDLPSLSSDSDKKDSLRKQLLSLSQLAEEAMTNLIWNSDSKLWIMRVIYKKSQASLSQLNETSYIIDAKFENETQQLQDLFTKTISQ